MSRGLHVREDALQSCDVHARPAPAGLKPSSGETGMEKDILPNFTLCGTCHVPCEDKPSFATRSARYRL
jgi:hypothetical protein